LPDGLAVKVNGTVVVSTGFQCTGKQSLLAVTQLWIKGERGFRRPDVLLYVNRIPLVFIELKNSNVKLRARLTTI
ncbi:type I restriction endonuclease, partial [Nitrosomonas supralitoralis]|uniref:type I restriction endonuclease n=1 Tax=Nitrosomonas supralitoralis TaxID=2116706 RepID=UPI001F5B7554